MDIGFKQWIIFILWIYSVSKHYYVNFISAKSAFAETLSNLWNFSSEFKFNFGLIQNLSALSHYTKTYHVGHWKHTILHAKYILFTILQILDTRKCTVPERKDQVRSIITSICIERTFTPLGRSTSKFVRYNYTNVDNFWFRFGYIDLIVFNLICSQYLDKLYLLCVGLNRNLFCLFFFWF